MAKSTKDDYFDSILSAYSSAVDQAKQEYKKDKTVNLQTRADEIAGDTFDSNSTLKAFREANADNTINADAAAEQKQSQVDQWKSDFEERKARYKEQREALAAENEKQSNQESTNAATNTALSGDTNGTKGVQHWLDEYDIDNAGHWTEVDEDTGKSTVHNVNTRGNYRADDLVLADTANETAEAANDAYTDVQNILTGIQKGEITIDASSEYGRAVNDSIALIDKYSTQTTQQQTRMDAAQKVLDSDTATDEQKAKAQEYYDDAEFKYNNAVNQYNKLLKRYTRNLEDYNTWYADNHDGDSAFALQTNALSLAANKTNATFAESSLYNSQAQTVYERAGNDPELREELQTWRDAIAYGMNPQATVDSIGGERAEKAIAAWESLSGDEEHQEKRDAILANGQAYLDRYDELLNIYDNGANPVWQHDNGLITDEEFYQAGKDYMAWQDSQAELQEEWDSIYQAGPTDNGTLAYMQWQNQLNSIQAQIDEGKQSEYASYSAEDATTLQNYVVERDYNDAEEKDEDAEYYIELGKKSNFVPETNDLSEKYSFAEGQAASNATPLERRLEYMTTQQKNTYYYLLGKGDTEGAQRYFTSIESSLRAEQIAKEVEEPITEFSEDHPLAGIALNAGYEAVVEPIAGVFNTIDKAVTKAVTGQDPGLTSLAASTHVNDYVTTGVANDISEKFGLSESTASFLAGTAVSMANSAASTVIFGVTGATRGADKAVKAATAAGATAEEIAEIRNTWGNIIKMNEWVSLTSMGTQAGTAAIQSSIENGDSIWKALIYGGVSGVVEVWTEKIGMDDFIKSATGNVSGLASKIADQISDTKLAKKFLEGTADRPALQQIAKILTGETAQSIFNQTLSEGGEEVLSEVTDYLADIMISAVTGDQSEFQKNYQTHIEEGQNETEAFWSTIKDLGSSCLSSFLGGALSGVGFGLANVPAVVLNHNAIGRSLIKNEQAETFVKMCKADFDQGSETYKLADSLYTKFTDKTNDYQFTAKDLTDLYKLAQNDRSVQYAGTVNLVIDTAQDGSNSIGNLATDLAKGVQITTENEYGATETKTTTPIGLEKAKTIASTLNSMLNGEEVDDKTIRKTITRDSSAITVLNKYLGSEMKTASPDELRAAVQSYNRTYAALTAHEDGLLEISRLTRDNWADAIKIAHEEEASQVAETMQTNAQTSANDTVSNENANFASQADAMATNGLNAATVKQQNAVNNQSHEGEQTESTAPDAGTYNAQGVHPADDSSKVEPKSDKQSTADKVVKEVTKPKSRNEDSIFGDIGVDRFLREAKKAGTKMSKKELLARYNRANEDFGDEGETTIYIGDGKFISYDYDPDTDENVSVTRNKAGMLAYVRESDPNATMEQIDALIEYLDNNYYNVDDDDEEADSVEYHEEPKRKANTKESVAKQTVKAVTKPKSKYGDIGEDAFIHDAHDNGSKLSSTELRAKYEKANKVFNEKGEAIIDIGDGAFIRYAAGENGEVEGRVFDKTETLKALQAANPKLKGLTSVQLDKTIENMKANGDIFSIDDLEDQALKDLAELSKNIWKIWGNAFSAKSQWGIDEQNGVKYSQDHPNLVAEMTAAKFYKLFNKMGIDEVNVDYTMKKSDPNGYFDAIKNADTDEIKYIIVLNGQKTDGVHSDYLIDRETGDAVKVRMRYSAAQNLSWILGHELGHKAQGTVVKWDGSSTKESNAVNARTNEIIAAYAKSRGLSQDQVDAEIKQRKDRYDKFYKERGLKDLNGKPRTMTDIEAKQEFASDCLGTLFVDQSLALRFTRSGFQNFVHDALDAVTDIIGTISGIRENGLGQTFKDVKAIMMNTAKQSQDMLAKCLQDTERSDKSFEVRTVSADVYNGTAEGAADEGRYSVDPADDVEAEWKDEQRYSIDTELEAIGLTYEKGKNGETIYKDADGHVVAHVSEDLIKNSALGKVLKNTLDTRLISKADYDAEIKFYADFFNMVLKTNDIDAIWAVSSSIGFNPLTEEVNTPGNRDTQRKKKNKFSALTKNSDPQYSSTVDFTTICLKTQAIVDVMSDIMVTQQRGLTPDEIVKIVYDETHKAGEPVPCPVCYVFSRWVGLGTVLDKMWRNQQNYANVEDFKPILDDLKVRVNEIMETEGKTGSKARDALQKLLMKEYNELTELQRQANESELAMGEPLTEEQQARKEELEKYIDVLDEYAWLTKVRTAEYVVHPTNGKIIRLTDGKFPVGSGETKTWIDSYEEDGKKYVDIKSNKKVYKTEVKGYEPVDPNVLFDINKGKEFAEQYPMSWAYRTTRGPSMGKATTPYAAEHLGQIITGIGSSDLSGLGDISKNQFLNFTKAGNWSKASGGAYAKIAAARLKMKAQNLLNGQRFQSTSDFRFEYALDYLMAFTELQAVGGKVQLYTKVPESVRFFASMGAEVNCSLMPAAQGYDILDDGTVVLKFSNVTGMDADDAFMLSSEFNNVQPIMVGVDTIHIRACMRDGRITFIIPYHASGGSEDRYRSMMKTVGETVEGRTDYAAYENDIIRDDSTPDQDRLRELRIKILTGKGIEITNAHDKELIRNNKWLSQLFQRFYGKTIDGGRANIDPKYLSAENRSVTSKDNDCQGVVLTTDQADKIMPYEFWDKTLTIDEAYLNGKEFVDYCTSLGIYPRFSGHKTNGSYVNKQGVKNADYKVDYVAEEDFTNEDGYWKTLPDRCMYNVVDDGNIKAGTYHEQQAINISKMDASYLQRDTVNEQVSTSPVEEYNGKKGFYTPSKVNRREIVKDISSRAQERMANANFSVDEVADEDIDYMVKTEDTASLTELATYRSGARFSLPVEPDKDYEQVSSNGTISNMTKAKLEEQIKNGEYVITYRSMQLINGKLYSPMAGLIEGKLEGGLDPNILSIDNPDAWEMASANWNIAYRDTVKKDKVGTYPKKTKWQLATGEGYYMTYVNDNYEMYILRDESAPDTEENRIYKWEFDLDKGNGGTVPARFNPWMHSSNLMLNDQFTEAFKRPNLVTVECVVPKSDVDGSFTMNGTNQNGELVEAMSYSGWQHWKPGGVALELKKKGGTERQLCLSTFIKPIRVVPNSEVAQHYYDNLYEKGISIPENVVTPDLLSELKKLGMKITHSSAVADWIAKNRDLNNAAVNELQKAWKKTAGGNLFEGYMPTDHQELMDFYGYDSEDTVNGTTSKYKSWQGKLSVSEEEDAAYKNAVESGDMKTAQRMVDQAAKDAGYTILGYHGTQNEGFTVFKPSTADSGFGDYKFADRDVTYFSSSESAAETYAKANWHKQPGKVYKTYLDLKNPYTINDANGRTSFQLKSRELREKEIEYAEDLPDRLFTVSSIEEANRLFYYLNMEVRQDEYGYELYSLGNNSLFGRDEVVVPFESFRDFYLDDDVKADFMERGLDISDEYGDDEYYYSTDEVVKLVQMMNEVYGREYDGVVINNVFDAASLNGSSGNDYITFNSNQIKSADPVTYDSKNDPIPLSERFNPKSNDIRYSVGDDYVSIGGSIDQSRFSDIVKDLNSGKELRLGYRDGWPLTVKANWDVGYDENGPTDYGWYKAEYGNNIDYMFSTPCLADFLFERDPKYVDPEDRYRYSLEDYGTPGVSDMSNLKLYSWDGAGETYSDFLKELDKGRTITVGYRGGGPMQVALENPDSNPKQYIVTYGNNELHIDGSPALAKELCYVPFWKKQQELKQQMSAYSESDSIAEASTAYKTAERKAKSAARAATRNKKADLQQELDRAAYNARREADEQRLLSQTDEETIEECMAPIAVDSKEWLKRDDEFAKRFSVDENAEEEEETPSTPWDNMTAEERTRILFNAIRNTKGGSGKKISRFVTHTINNSPTTQRIRDNLTLQELKDMGEYKTERWADSVEQAVSTLDASPDAWIDEQKRLTKKAKNGELWMPYELDEAMMILSKLQDINYTKQDFAGTIEFAKIIRSQGTSGGQFISAFAKYANTAADLAVRSIDNLEKKLYDLSGDNSEARQKVQEGIWVDGKTASELEHQVEDLEGQVKDLNKKLETALINAPESDLTEEEIDALDDPAMQRKIRKAREQRDAKQKQYDNVKAELDKKLAELEKLRKQRDSLNNKAKNGQKRVEELRGEIADLMDQLDEIGNEMDRFDDYLGAIKEERDNLRKNLRDKNKEIVNKRQQDVNLRGEIAELQDDLDTINNEMSRFDDYLNGLKTSKYALKNKIKRAQESITRNLKLQKELSQWLEDKGIELNDLLLQKNKLSKENSDLLKQRRELSSKILRARNRIDALKKSISYLNELNEKLSVKAEVMVQDVATGNEIWNRLRNKDSVLYQYMRALYVNLADADKAIAAAQNHQSMKAIRKVADANGEFVKQILNEAEDMFEIIMSSNKKAEIQRHMLTYSNLIDKANEAWYRAAEEDTNALNQAKSDLVDTILNIAKYRGFNPGKTIRGRMMKQEFKYLNQFAMASLSNITEDYRDRSGQEKAAAVQYVNQLLNLRTAMRNIFSNAAFYGLESIQNNTLGVLFDMAISGSTRRRTKGEITSRSVGTTWGKNGRTQEQKALGMDKVWGLNSKSDSESFNRAERSALEVMFDVDTGNEYGGKYEQVKVENDNSRRTFKLTYKESQKRIGVALQKFMSNLEKINGYSLNVSDEWFKGATYQSLINSYAKFMADGIMSEDQAIALATEELKYRTFQDDTWEGKVLNAIHSFLNSGREFDENGNVVYKDTAGKTKDENGKPISLAKANKAVWHMGQRDFGIGDVVVKYRGVPGALVDRAIEYSPLGLGKAFYYLAKYKQSVKSAVNNGDGNEGVNLIWQRKAAMGFSRAVTGSSLIGLMTMLVLKGIAKRKDDLDDKDVAAQESAQGLGGTQINLSVIYRRWFEGDTSYEWKDGDDLIDIGFMDPISSILTMGTITAQLLKDHDFESLWENGGLGDWLGYTALGSAQGVVASFKDLSMMSFVADMYDCWYYNRGDGAEMIREFCTTIATSAITSFQPSLLRQVAQAQDPYYRDTYSSGGRIQDWLGGSDNMVVQGAVNSAQEMYNQIAVNVPFLRRTVDKKTDNFGEAKTYSKSDDDSKPGNGFAGLAGRILNFMVNPGKANHYTTNEVLGELEAIYDQTGSSVMLDRNGPSSISFTANGETTKYELTSDEKQTYKESVGEMYEGIVSALMDTEAYKNADNETKVEFLTNGKSYAEYIAKQEFLQSKGVDYTDNNWNTTERIMDAFGGDDTATNFVDAYQIARETNSSGKYFTLNTKYPDMDSSAQLVSYLDDFRGTDGKLSKTQYMNVYNAVKGVNTTGTFDFDVEYSDEDRNLQTATYTVEMSAADKARFAKEADATYQSYAAECLNSDEWSTMSVEDRANLLDKSREYAKYLTKQEWFDAEYGTTVDPSSETGETLHYTDSEWRKTDEIMQVLGSDENSGFMQSQLILSDLDDDGIEAMRRADTTGVLRDASEPAVEMAYLDTSERTAEYTDNEKSALFAVLTNESSTSDKVQALIDGGLTFSDATDIYGMKSYIDNTQDEYSGDTGMNEESRFTAWLNEQNYSNTEKDLIHEQFGFYNMVRQEAETTVTNLVSTGMSADTANTYIKGMNAAADELGDDASDTEKKKAKLDYVVNSNLTDEQKQALASGINGTNSMFADINTTTAMSMLKAASASGDYSILSMDTPSSISYNGEEYELGEDLTDEGRKAYHDSYISVIDNMDVDWTATYTTQDGNTSKAAGLYKALAAGKAQYDALTAQGVTIDWDNVSTSSNMYKYYKAEQARQSCGVSYAKYEQMYMAIQKIKYDTGDGEKDAVSDYIQSQGYTGSTGLTLIRLLYRSDVKSL